MKENKPFVKNYISIIIVTKDRPDPIMNIIKTLNKQNFKNFEVILVDSSKIDQEKKIRQMMKEENINYQLQYLKVKQARVSWQRVIGIEHAIGEVYVFIDDDFELNNNFLGNIMKIIKTESKMGGQGDFYLKRNLTSKINEAFFLTNGYSPFGNGNIKLSGAFQSKKKVERPVKMKCISGGGAFFHKKIFDEYMIDPTLPTSCASDLEFSCRVSKKYSLYLFPQLKCVHKHFKSGKPDIEETTSNFIYFQARHFKRIFFAWWRVPFFLWSQVGYLIRFISLTISKREPKYIRGWGKGASRVLKKILVKS